MKKNFVKNLCLSTCAITMLITPSSIFASESINTDFTNYIQKDIEPRFNVTTNTYISTDGWSTFATDNNVFHENVKVTNDSNNPGDILVRVVDVNGKTIIEATTVSLGTTIDIGEVPAQSGTYSVQAKAISKSGTYKLNAR